MSTVRFSSLYSDNLHYHNQRYSKLKARFEKHFRLSPDEFFSASGRTEVIGNHTDHNHGKVMAAAVNLDVIAAVSKTSDGIITLKSEGYPFNTVDTSDLSVHSEETSHSNSLIRGICARFSQLGYNVGGFNAVTSSDVLKGSGLSSSAAFEVLVGTILNHLYNDGKISDVEIAKIAQYSENVYFGKPSGLMDQMASSVGGFIKIDFEDTEKPIIEAIDFDIDEYEHALCIIDTKGNHADLTPEYAAIPSEMKAVAEFFGKKVLREITKGDVIGKANDLRSKLGDRAVLRALHFFDENERVESLTDSIKSGDFNSFLNTIKLSGNSSYKYLQNVFASSAPEEQGLSLALYLADGLLNGEGAARVHGGGFAGTIQAFVPKSKLSSFKEGIESVFGEGSCHVLNIRHVGGTKVIL